MNRIYYVGARIDPLSHHLLCSYVGAETSHHVTLAYSRGWFPYEADHEVYPCAAAGPFEYGFLGPTMVLFVTAPALAQRHRELRAAGATWDLPGYRPHVTIKRLRSSETLVLPQAPIVLSYEYYGTWEGER